MSLMRLPLAITAISNGAGSAVLRHARGYGDEWNWPAAIAVAAMSFGLYTFGMVSNDIIDVRRDRVLAPHVPAGLRAVWDAAGVYPGGRLLLIGCGGGFSYAVLFGGGLKRSSSSSGPFCSSSSTTLQESLSARWGFLTLGLIRFFHAAMPQPSLEVIWHPLLIMDHVVILSAMCYWLEGQAPPAQQGPSVGHRLGPAGAESAASGRYHGRPLVAAGLGFAPQALGISRALVFPGIAIVIFIAFAGAMLLSVNSISDKSRRERADFQRRTGRRLMLFGLLWLVLYDIAFSYGYLREL